MSLSSSHVNLHNKIDGLPQIYQDPVYVMLDVGEWFRRSLKCIAMIRTFFCGFVSPQSFTKCGRQTAEST